jgi:hypothetical protein
MNAPEKRPWIGLPLGNQEGCLRELREAGATPEQMTRYSLINFTVPVVLWLVVVGLGLLLKWLA